MNLFNLSIKWPDRNLWMEAPRGYGVAWRNYDMRTTTLIIIPLNFLFAWARTWYYILVAGPRDRLTSQLIESLSVEEVVGYTQGYKAGFESGEKAGMLRAKALFETVMK